jgi:hypothetical protein
MTNNIECDDPLTIVRRVDGRLFRSFRVTEDRTFADLTDSVCDVPVSAKVGIVHPLHLSIEEKCAWGEI